MKIAYLENVRIPSERAHAYQIVQTVAELSRAGAEVALVNPARTSEDVFSFFHLPKDVFTHVTLTVFDPLSWTWPISKPIAYYLQRWSFGRVAARWIQGQQADIWFTRDPWIVDRLSSQTTHGAWVLELHTAEGLSRERLGELAKRVTLFVVITNGLRGRLIELGVPEAMIHVSPDGFDPSAFENLPSRAEARLSLGLSNDRFVVMYTGGFYPWKGVDMVVEAWKVAPKNATLVLIGGPEGDRKRLEQLAAGFSADSIKILPQRPHSELVRLLPAADVALLPTSPLFEIGRSYTSPLKQFEYLAAGLPILATDVPSSHEVLTNKVAKFFTHEPKAFLRTLEEVMRDREWQKAAEPEGRALVQDYAWSRRAQRLLERLIKIEKRRP